MTDRIVITGVAINAPFGRTLKDLGSLLDGGIRRPKPVDRFPVGGAKVGSAHLHWPVQDIEALIDGTTETALAALDAARLATGHRIGLALGSISGMDFDATGPRRADDGVNALGRHCFDRLGLFGPLVHVTSACTSSAAALFWAKSILENDDADVMLAGGADRIRAVDFAGFNILRAMDPEDTRPFHTERRGITMGEGACILVLERMSHALARGADIHAVFSGGGLSSDGHHATAPRHDGLVAASRRALAAAGLTPADIQYVNCHGTGTPANDREELKALQAVFGPHLRAVCVGSTKGFTGHWLGSAGAIEAAVLLSVLHRQRAPGMPWLSGPDSILASHTAGTEEARGFRHVMSNSLGFGGNNASLIFSRFSRHASEQG